MYCQAWVILREWVCLHWNPSYDNNLHSHILCVPEIIYTVRGWEKLRHPKVKDKKKREGKKYEIFTGKTKFPRKQQKCHKVNKLKCCGTVKKLGRM